ncbi:MAG TPA: hypothetical protein VGL91_03795 [Acidobacteriota bacterium]
MNETRLPERINVNPNIFGGKPIVIVLVMLFLRPLGAAPISVRYVEGTIHGFLALRAPNGSVIASGDLLQVKKGGEMQSRMLFRFKDGSIYDETVTYTQERVFTMQNYRLVQHGPAFADDTEISMERSGRYRVKTKAHKDGKEKALDGRLDLPSDVYNGMVITVVKNLPKGRGETVHLVVFEPTPRLIQLQMIPANEEKVKIGEGTKNTTHYLFKPQLGIWLKILAKLLGKLPPDSHAWITNDQVPAFLRADEPLSISGPICRIELTAPRW